MKTIITVVSLLVVMASSAIAAEGVAGKSLSIVQFSQAPENRGISGRLLDRRYQEYRSGRLAVTTMDTAHLR